ncbi:MAG: hypothetical protein M1818_001902 [Claussenomyces sp. TS43310]|nr:MAG: hypothetical protein M1818_001902 [Claussenomyces sp. TS43310]
MASPMTCTPSSAASPATTAASSPPNLAPAPQTLAIKTTATVMMKSIAPTGTMPPKPLGPNKEWILPPRPKPGRKPATDTPPTKRKAQNRAAQRAFRERRAARVGELEDQLRDTEEQRQRHEMDMCDQILEQTAEISRLEAEVKKFSDDTKAWRERYYALDNALAVEKRGSQAMLVELNCLRKGARSTGTDAVPLPPRRPQRKPSSDASATFEVQTTSALGCGRCIDTGDCACVRTAMGIADSGCGKCASETHCECLEETLKGPSHESMSSSDLKRSLSPSRDIYDQKRPKRSMEQRGPLEIDFTAAFTSKFTSAPVRPSQDVASMLNAPPRSAGDSCGFCDGNTFCLCAEAAAQSTNTTFERESDIRLAPLLHEVTPPPSDSDVTVSDPPSSKIPSLYPNHRMQHAIKPVTRATENSCTGGPGSCRQCQEDPKSGLFCRSLAAMRGAESSSTSDAGCCGSGVGCCKLPPSLPPATEPSLSCAETYKTLASHRNFDQASDELGNWLPKLHTVAPKYPGRGPVDIEAASVMNVIKYFDIRFGRD